ncbi:MAG: aldehyde dehydrogenase family protein [Thermoleophilia bacterium]|nr:aldehyde dehydrogenase family protein [Thermoleophilia bacterium]
MATTVTPGVEPVYLDGAWLDTGSHLEVRSPYSGEVVATVSRAGAGEARAAVDAAARALAAPLAPWRRAEILERVSQLLRERQEEIAQIVSAEAGKPIRNARVEVARAAGTHALSAIEARRLSGDMIPITGTEPGDGHVAFTVRVPIGIIGAISPFNFPLNLVAHKVAPAIAAGCPIILKPASQTPVSALRLAALYEEAGLPAGWLQVIPGAAAAIGDVFVSDDRVRMITFTGSAEVGWEIKARAARKKVVLELGNASPVIVAPDADLELVARKVATHAYSYAGQTCISIQRVIAHRDVIDSLTALLVPQIDALRVGDPAEETTDVGPLIDAENRDRVLEWIEEAVQAGATVLSGGVVEAGVIRPTLLANVPLHLRVCRQEVFGPVCTLIPYDTLDEALALANSTEYGLQAAIFTRSIAPALAAVRALEFGSVMINEAPEYRVDQMPYGGTKASGNTKEGPGYTVREMTEERLVVLATG